MASDDEQDFAVRAAGISRKGAVESARITSRGSIAAATVGAVAAIVVACIALINKSFEEPKPAPPAHPGGPPSLTASPSTEGGTVHSLPATHLPQAGASVKLAPDMGPAGSRTVITGTGFQAGEQVRIVWHTEAIGAYQKELRDTTAAADGSISVEILIPDDDKGVYGVGAKGVASEIKAKSFFTLT